MPWGYNSEEGNYQITKGKQVGFTVSQQQILKDQHWSLESAWAT